MSADRASPTPAGFTLIELIIAMALSGIVIVGIFGVASQMMRVHVQSAAKGENTNWALMSLDSMQRELSNGTVLYCPYADASHAGCPGPTSTVLSGCSDYTLSPGVGPLDGNPANVRSFYYCVWSAGTPSGTPWLLHYTGTTCPISPAPVCGAGNFEVVAQDIYPYTPAQNYYFQRAPAGVQLFFTIGQPVPTSNNPTPSVTRVDTQVTMQKTYANKYD
jgi:prepilin-type N-terminal cleavage/methylation domain-containing protein